MVIYELNLDEGSMIHGMVLFAKLSRLEFELADIYALHTTLSV